MRGGGSTRGKGKGKGKMGEGEKRLGELEEELEGVEVLDGKLTVEDIANLQRYYDNAIRSHTNDLDGMVDAVWAVLYHSLSTDANPRHSRRPNGEDSWCKYQRALARRQDVPPHNNCIPDDLEVFLKPRWEPLCATTLLEKCLLGAT